MDPKGLDAPSAQPGQDVEREECSLHQAVFQESSLCSPGCASGEHSCVSGCVPGCISGKATSMHQDMFQGTLSWVWNMHQDAHQNMFLESRICASLYVFGNHFCVSGCAPECLFSKQGLCISMCLNISMLRASGCAPSRVSVNLFFVL